MYGLLAAILGTIQGFAKPNNETKDETNKRLYTWKYFASICNNSNTNNIYSII